MVLHAKHAAGVSSTRKIRTFWYFFLVTPNLGKCYLQKGKGSNRRIVRISEVANQLERQLADGITKQEACEALMGLHALTGCDTVSAFSSKGKLKPMQMLVKNHNNEEHWQRMECKGGHVQCHRKVCMSHANTGVQKIHVAASRQA